MPHEASWLPVAALERMEADLIAHNELTRSQLAQRVIQDASPLAAYRIIEIATSSEDEAIALKAAMYVVDRELGKPNTRIQLDTTPQNPVLQLIEGVVVQRGVPVSNYEEHPSYTPAQDESTPGHYPSATVIDQEPRRNPFDPEAPDYTAAWIKDADGTDPDDQENPDESP